MTILLCARVVILYNGKHLSIALVVYQMRDVNYIVRDGPDIETGRASIHKGFNWCCGWNSRDHKGDGLAYISAWHIRGSSLKLQDSDLREAFPSSLIPDKLLALSRHKIYGLVISLLLFVYLLPSLCNCKFDRSVLLNKALAISNNSCAIANLLIVTKDP